MNLLLNQETSELTSWNWYVNKSAEGKRKNIDYTDSRAIKKVKKESEKSDTILKELKNTNARVTKNVTASTEKSNTNLEVLEEILLKFFKSRSNFSLSSASEAVLQAVAELLLQENQIPELPELCLVIDNNKPKGDDNKPNLTTLNDILLSADDQFKKYMNVIIHGPAQDGKPGIIDSRILIKQQPKY
ncbi:16211_t:CDS:2 [Dentiscutata heterogama]|uniref:16211_t:CDS:1 n=1 Tax=Dentiscutata heterogama TaxID=1316150 RepID=A0ACA9K4M2_9GLOM|nr:16211_t:CDS:2 [Dentiscutata heterogama]